MSTVFCFYLYLNDDTRSIPQSRSGNLMGLSVELHDWAFKQALKLMLFFYHGIQAV